MHLLVENKSFSGQWVHESIALSPVGMSVSLKAISLIIAFSILTLRLVCTGPAPHPPWGDSTINKEPDSFVDLSSLDRGLWFLVGSLIIKITHFSSSNFTSRHLVVLPISRTSPIREKNLSCSLHTLQGDQSNRIKSHTRRVFWFKIPWCGSNDTKGLLLSVDSTQEAARLSGVLTHKTTGW